MTHGEVMRHRCGGYLISGPIWVAVQPDSTQLVGEPDTLAQLPGFVCDRCGDRLIAAGTVREIQARGQRSHVCGYDWLDDGSYGCERCQRDSKATEGGD